MCIKIFVAYHKDSPLIKNEIFEPIQVGRINSSVKLNMIGDDTGNNISIRNPIYCELTAVYWAWKNDNSNYVGLCHYRRLFTLARKSFIKRFCASAKYHAAKLFNLLHPGIECSFSKQISTSSLESFREMANDFTEKIFSDITNYDAIVPYPIKFATINVRRFFEVSLEHKLLMDKIVHELNPDFELWYKKTMNGNILYAANMFVFKREIFIEYCNTIFPILEEHEKRTVEMGWCSDVLKEKSYSRRSGYFGEFLTSAFIEKIISENKKVMMVNTVFLSQI